MTLDEVFVGMFFTANILFCLAYVVRSMLWLRAITIAGAFFTFPYFFNQEEPLWSALFWQSMFILINAVNLVDLLLRMRPVKLGPLEQKLHLLVFNLMQPRDMLYLLRAGTWKHCDPGDALVNQGSFLNGLCLMADGKTEVVVDGLPRAELQEGDFVGEMSFITGNAATAEVRASTGGEYIFWDRTQLESLYLKRPALRDAMQAALGRNMAAKLHRSNTSR